MQIWGWDLALALEKAEHSKISHFYYDYLQDALKVFKTAILCFKCRKDTEGSVAAALDMSHRIKGNAAMYGHGQLGLMAAESEVLLRKLDSNAKPDEAHLSLMHLTQKIELICEEIDLGQTEHNFRKPFIEIHNEELKVVEEDIGLKRKTILVAYCDVWVSNLIASLFTSEFDVKICKDEEEFLSEALLRKPNLIILENGFGQTGSFKLFETLKQSTYTKDTPILMTFEANRPQEIAKAISLGVYDFVDNKNDILNVVDASRNILHKINQKVLIVDDDFIVRELLSDVLSGSGFEVETASDGLEALDCLSKSKPNIVLLDRFMPGLDGGSVLYEIKNNPELQSIPVLILTAMVNRREATSWFERGAADFIPKPFDPEEVLMRIKQHMEIPKQRNFG